MTSGIVPRILAKQNENGSFGVPEDFYLRCKYHGTVWTAIVLAELGANGNDERIQKLAAFLIANSQDQASGGFAVQSGPRGGGDHAKVIPCLTGNMLYSLLRFGKLPDDPAVKSAIDCITTYQRFDDGVPQAPQGWPYTRFPNCYGKHTCFMGVVKSLKALAEIPAEARTGAVKLTIARGAEFLLIHHLYKRSSNLSQVGNKRWLNLNFPRMYNTDYLEMLNILVRLGYCDERMQDAAVLLISGQDKDGRWHMGKSYNSRLLVSVEKDGKPSKWLTLQALSVLKGLSGD
jgi:hypothetical protein